MAQHAHATPEPEPEPVPDAATDAPRDGDHARDDAQPEAQTAPDTPALVEARAVVESGEALFAAGNYDAALAEFERAYELMGDDPRRAALLNNIAVCHERAFRYDLSLRYYHRYLTEGAADPSDRAEVQAIIRTLENLLGTLVIETDTPGEVWIDDRLIGKAPGQLSIPAGEHLVSVRAALHAPEQREVRIAARQTRTLVIQLQPLSDYRGLSPGYFYAGVGATAVSLATAATLGLVALHKRGQAEDAKDAGAGYDTPKFNRARDAIGPWMNAGDIALGASLVFAITTGVLYVLTDWQGDERRAPPGATNATLSVGSDGQGAWVRGVF